MTSHDVYPGANSTRTVSRVDDSVSFYLQNADGKRLDTGILNRVRLPNRMITCVIATHFSRGTIHSTLDVPYQPQVQFQLESQIIDSTLENNLCSTHQTGSRIPGLVLRTGFHQNMQPERVIFCVHSRKHGNPTCLSLLTRTHSSESVLSFIYLNLCRTSYIFPLSFCSDGTLRVGSSGTSTT